MNPLSLFVLHTVETAPGMTPGNRYYLFADRYTAHVAGMLLVNEKPAEAASLVFSVAPLEGEPAA
jgi:hypothetical protein